MMFRSGIVINAEGRVMKYTEKLIEAKSIVLFVVMGYREICHLLKS